MSVRLHGLVKSYNDAMGFGYITPDGGGGDLFAHFSAITGTRFKTLREGQRVTFAIHQGPKGTQAADIAPEDLDDTPVVVALRDEVVKLRRRVAELEQQLSTWPG